MSTALVTHPACVEHKIPPGHPERPARLGSVLDAVAGLPLHRLAAATATPEHLSRAHSSELVRTVLDVLPFEAADCGYAQIDADTYMSAGSAKAAVAAAGAVIGAVDSVLSGEVQNAFCAVRPPGHHAERARAMGFCLFNNIAVGALHARIVHGLGKIAIVDFDVHHGNGTQDIFCDDPHIFYASTHQMPLYPGTGFPAERGIADNILNCPLPSGAGSAEFRGTYENFVLPALEASRPELILISAGFDGHRADPLANLNLTEDDFAWVTREMCTIASRVCGGRVVSSLEGGYDLDALAASTRAHVIALMET